MAEDYPGGGEVMRKAFELRDIPKESIRMMISSLSVSSRKQYECAFKKWWSFCKVKAAQTFKVTGKLIIEFLTEGYKNGASHGSLNSTRSSMAFLFGPEIDRMIGLGNFFKGVANLRPSLSKYDKTWDPKIVSEFLSQLYSNEEISSENPSVKLVRLLALVTWHRMQTQIANVRKTETAIEIKIPDRI